MKLNITTITPWLKFCSSQNLVWTGGFIIFHLRLRMVFENSLEFSENLAWILKSKKKIPNTYIPHNTKQYSEKLLLSIHKKNLILAPYIYISYFVCLTLPACNVMLLWILLLPRLLLLFPEKTHGQLNLGRCRTVLLVDSGSTLSSSCYVCQELHRQKRHSHCHQGQSSNCRGGEKLPAFLYIYLPA